jgi:DNA helicase-2/ATP-dependent DNA helicase PcrA
MDLNSLNDIQREAVEITEGPLLILAGAGSGKTRVLTHKIAYLIEEKNIFPSNILAITFTNKASEEMKNRVDKLIGGKSVGLWMGTFHSVCLRVLRRNANVIGYKSDFTIYDVADQNTVVKKCLKELNIDTKQLNPKHVRNIISMAKNEMITPEKFEELHEDEFKYASYIKIYKMYQSTLKKNNSMDFDDLINNTIIIFKENDDILKFYQRKFEYILIDEYQDTNHSQYLFALLLSGIHNNICAVGDADQSIYKFRGADIRNIYEFEKDYKDAKIIKLEQNYRSTQTILDAANNMISNNVSRKPKNLWTSKGKGGKINYYQAYTEKDEAEYVFDKIKQYKNNSFDEFAILYRTNAQSRVFEDVFRKNRIPYQIIGGLKFYERMEIKDILAYLKLIQNPVDNISFERIINVPKRSIGKRSVEKLNEFANSKGISLYESLLEIEDCFTISPRTMKSFKSFREIIRPIRSELNSLNVIDIFDEIIEKTGYIENLKVKDTIQDSTRIENVKELKSGIIDFVKTNEDDPSLSNFLAATTLQAGIDNMDDNVPGVLMMTFHSAKGLEFPNVFLVGMEENLFPSYMSSNTDEDLEEERRLCYVGITRAEKQLFITHSISRMLYGKTNRNEISRFIGEIPEKLLDSDSKTSNRMILNTKKYYKKSNDKKENINGSGDDYKAGMKVKHKIFGSGTVIDSMDGVLTIAFEGRGIKKLMAGVVPIEIVG